MYYNNTDTKTYTESEIKALYPNTSFPSPFVAPDEFSVVFDTPKPTVTELQIAYQDGTELDSKGNRVVKWSIRDMFADYTDELNIVHTKLEQDTAYLLAQFKAKVPPTITKVQAMRAMKQTDVNVETRVSMWTNFQALIASNIDANDEWLLALELQRSHPLVLALTPALGKTERQIDELFILGATL